MLVDFALFLYFPSVEYFGYILHLMWLLKAVPLSKHYLFILPYWWPYTGHLIQLELFVGSLQGFHEPSPAVNLPLPSFATLSQSIKDYFSSSRAENALAGPS